ncbi:putative methyltransferase [Trypanosoma theileri]|uniref:Putative methyltransferase n=1 Tax=Trypanosoma theileri TaxID=67003 RepID=A0A1X0P6V4_9TRYP|nr:putative methyltransferase [Trypanosoma theileri]ORC92662.1 putative methyltransferase [Trypanosoma theileri]
MKNYLASAQTHRFQSRPMRRSGWRSLTFFMMILFIMMFLWLFWVTSRGLPLHNDDVKLKVNVETVSVVEGGKNDLLAESGMAEGEDVRTSLRGLACPPYDPAALDRLQIPLKHLPRKIPTSVAMKYNRRAHNCVSDGVWHRVRAEDHRDILHGIVKLGRIQNNSFVFDWGSGCGHTMQFLYDFYGVSSVGIDVANATIFYARKLTSPNLLHCVADGTNISWIPSNFFDHAISFGAVLHVYNHTLFCNVLRQMVRVVKPLGTVYNGWSEEDDFRREYVPLCFSDLPVKYEIVEEKDAFSHVKIFPLKARQFIPNTYSLVITKGTAEEVKGISDNVYNDVDAVPFRCRGPKQMFCFLNKESENDVSVHHISGEESIVNVKWPTCPPYDASFEERQIPLKHLPRKKPTSVAQKYDRRANNCKKDGIWHRVSIHDHEAILRVIAELLKVKSGDRLLDWGSGCGHHLEFMNVFFGAVGLGIDISNKTVEYAREMTTKKNQYCVADGTRLEWLPSNFFDHAYSFGSIYHVYNETLFCSVLQQMVRVVKVGGKVYNGWTEESEFSRNNVLPCLGSIYNENCFKIEILEERKTFEHVKYFPLKAYQKVPNTYSLLIHKLSSCQDTSK